MWNRKITHILAHSFFQIAHPHLAPGGGHVKKTTVCTRSECSCYFLYPGFITPVPHCSREPFILRIPNSIQNRECFPKTSIKHATFNHRLQPLLQTPKNPTSPPPPPRTKEPRQMPRSLKLLCHPFTISAVGHFNVDRLKCSRQAARIMEEFRGVGGGGKKRSRRRNSLRLMQKAKGEEG